MKNQIKKKKIIATSPTVTLFILCVTVIIKDLLYTLKKKKETKKYIVKKGKSRLV